MFKFVYHYLTESSSRSYDIEIRRAIETIEEYGLWKEYTAEEKDTIFEITSEERQFFKTEKGDKIVYDLFYENLHIHVSDSEKEKICSIRIKNPNEAWICPQPGNGVVDFSHPCNHNHEVYVWYIVPVLDVTEAIGSMYKHGTWDKYVYGTMNRFFNSIKDETDSSKFNGYYNK